MYDFTCLQTHVNTSVSLHLCPLLLFSVFGSAILGVCGRAVACYSFQVHLLNKKHMFRLPNMLSGEMPIQKFLILFELDNAIILKSDIWNGIILKESLFEMI